MLRSVKITKHPITSQFLQSSLRICPSIGGSFVKQWGFNPIEATPGYLLGCGGSSERRRIILVATHQQTGYLPHEGRMLTVSEVAHHLGAHINSVRRWADIGLLHCYRIGVRGHRRFRAEDVEVFLKSSGRGSNDSVAGTEQSNGYHAKFPW